MQPAIAAETVHPLVGNLTADEVDPIFTPVGEWLKQIAQAELVEITNIQIEATADGLTLRLESTGQLVAPETSITGNAAIADIPNAVLNLSDDDDFFASDPTEGIALINVANLPDNRVGITITGTDALPTIDISTGATGLTVSATPGDPTAQAPNDSIRIVVTGEQEGYFVPDASTATRTDTPLRDVPQSIQVIPRQVIENQQAIGLDEVLENAAGVTFQGDDGGRSAIFNIRGFDGAAVLRDGFIIPGFRTDPVEPEVANLEQIEVLRGPASVLYGQAEPGGVINLVSKQPLSEPYYNLQLQAGNRGFVSPSIDLSGPLTEDGRLLYRLNALYRREESFQDFENDFERFFIAPTLTWQISDQTDLTVSLEYAEDDEPLDLGTVAIGDGIADIPPERVLNDPDSTVERDSLSVRYTLQHRFSDNWQIRNRFLYASSTFDWSVVAFSFSLDESTGVLNRLLVSEFAEVDTYSLYTNVQGKFNTGPIEHTLLLGVDLFRAENQRVQRLNPRDPLLSSPINIFDPDNLDVETPPVESIPITNDDTTTTNQLGIYLQDQIDILDNLILVGGVRYDTVDQEITNNLNDLETEQDDDALTPRIGIVYQPIEPISLYANYSRSFAPNSETNADGEPLEPEEGEGFEVGVRGEIIENRLSATLAYFDITKQNVATADPNDPFASVAVGEQRSRGVDFSLTGEILPGWNAVASYAYIDAEVTEDNTDIVENRLIGVPAHSASLWMTYEIQSGDLQGVGFGLGFNFVGEREGDLENSYKVDSYFLTNAAVFYRRDNWRVRLNVDNLFDVNYIETPGDRVRFNEEGDPFTLRASISYTF